MSNDFLYRVALIMFRWTVINWYHNQLISINFATCKTSNCYLSISTMWLSSKNWLNFIGHLIWHICGISTPKIEIVSLLEMISYKIIQNVLKFIETFCNYVENFHINDLNEMDLRAIKWTSFSHSLFSLGSGTFISLALSIAIFSRSIKVKWMGNWNSKSEWNKLWSISLKCSLCASFDLFCCC